MHPYSSSPYASQRQQQPSQQKPSKSKLTIGGVATAFALVVALGTWFFPDIGDRVSGESKDETEGASNDPVASDSGSVFDPDAAEAAEWVTHFEDLELELPDMSTSEDMCTAGMIDLESENPHPAEAGVPSYANADLTWALCSSSQATWETAEPCSRAHGCLLAGDVSLGEHHPAAIVSDVGALDAEACREAAERGDTDREGQGNNHRWNVKLMWNATTGTEYVSAPNPDGICLDAGEEVFRIEFSSLEYTFDKEASVISDCAFIVLVTSWTRA